MKKEKKTGLKVSGEAAMGLDLDLDAAGAGEGGEAVETAGIVESNAAKKLNKILGYMIAALGVLMVLFHMINAKTYIMASIQFLNLHLSFALMIVFFVTAQKAKRMVSKYILIVFALISFLATLYVHIDYDGIQNRAWANTPLDLIVGVAVIVMGLCAVKSSIGWFMPILIVGVTIYPFFGQYLPEPFTTRAYPIAQTISNLSISLTTGMYSNNLRTSAEYIFLFVVFGSLLSATGVQKFFWELGKLLFRNLRSGPGMMAVLNSALVGSVTGSALANVMITGVYTIPAMKKAGYTSEQAGALEAAASSGGQIMPPVMGIVAFIMASYTGIPYIKIVAMAVIPALLYYFGVGIYAHFVTYKRVDIKTSEIFKDGVDFRTFFWKMPGFIVPLGIIIVMLSNNMSVMEAAFWAILCLIVISQFVPKDLRPSFKDIFQGLVDGAKEASSLAVTISTIGLILITFSGSGLAVKLASGIENFSGGTMIGVLLIVWAMCILFGMIGVSTIGYYMGAAFAGSVLINMGLSLEATHFFLMFPCIFSVITPPVAMASLVAAKVAKGQYMKTAWETVKCAFMGFMLPFLVVYSPSVILGRSPADPLFWFEILYAAIFVVTGQLAFVGTLKAPMTVIERLLLAGASVVIMVFQIVSQMNIILLLLPLALIAAFVLLHRNTAKKHTLASANAAPVEATAE